MALAVIPIVGTGQSCDATSELYFYLPPGEKEGELEISDWDTHEYITIYSDLDEEIYKSITKIRIHHRVQRRYLGCCTINSSEATASDVQAHI